MPQKQQNAKSKYTIFMKRTKTSPWIRAFSTDNREYAIRLTKQYERDYPNSQIELIQE